jgi:aryl-alcohol dehydrogenase-like predicted oxidoreductase
MPIPGTSSREHLRENLNASSLTLSAEDVEAIGTMVYDCTTAQEAER